MDVRVGVVIVHLYSQWYINMQNRVFFLDTRHIPTNYIRTLYIFFYRFLRKMVEYFSENGF